MFLGWVIASGEHCIAYWFYKKGWLQACVWHQPGICKSIHYSKLLMLKTNYDHVSGEENTVGEYYIDNIRSGGCKQVCPFNLYMRQPVCIPTPVLLSCIMTYYSPNAPVTFGDHRAITDITDGSLDCMCLFYSQREFKTTFSLKHE